MLIFFFSFISGYKESSLSNSSDQGPKKEPKLPVASSSHFLQEYTLPTSTRRNFLSCVPVEEEEGEDRHSIRLRTQPTQITLLTKQLNRVSRRIRFVLLVQFSTRPNWYSDARFQGNIRNRSSWTVKRERIRKNGEGDLHQIEEEGSTESELMEKGADAEHEVVLVT
ncbi:hypothetical protein J437_LFUL007068, partial [Ladona fulva]